MTSTTTTQRWRNRRDRHVPAGILIDPERLGIDILPEARARAFVLEHHYSGSYPAARMAFGLFARPAGAMQADLMGVAVLSVPVQPRAVPAYTGLPSAAGVDLGRLVLIDAPEVAGNAESWFVSRVLKAARRELGVDAVISYSDPLPRLTADGVLVKPGHVGLVYQALSAAYGGRAAPRTLWLRPDGTVLAPRTLDKLRKDDRGAAGAYRQLLLAGAPRRHTQEPGDAYVARALAEGPFTRIRHPGNHVYAWGLTREARRNIREITGTDPHLRYPKAK